MATESSPSFARGRRGNDRDGVRGQPSEKTMC